MLLGARYSPRDLAEARLDALDARLLAWASSAFRTRLGTVAGRGEALADVRRPREVSGVFAGETLGFLFAAGSGLQRGVDPLSAQVSVRAVSDSDSNASSADDVGGVDVAIELAEGATPEEVAGEGGRLRESWMRRQSSLTGFVNYFLRCNCTSTPLIAVLLWT